MRQSAPVGRATLAEDLTQREGAALRMEDAPPNRSFSFPRLLVRERDSAAQQHACTMRSPAHEAEAADSRALPASTLSGGTCSPRRGRCNQSLGRGSGESPVVESRLSALRVALAARAGTVDSVAWLPLGTETARCIARLTSIDSSADHLRPCHALRIRSSPHSAAVLSPPFSLLTSRHTLSAHFELSLFQPPAMSTTAILMLALYRSQGADLPPVRLAAVTDLSAFK